MNLDWFLGHLIDLLIEHGLDKPLTADDLFDMIHEAARRTRDGASPGAKL